MNNLSKIYNYNLEKDGEEKYLCFTLGENKYAVNAYQVVEIMKLPHLESPHRMVNNVIGLLNYNNFMINVLDLRFYLNAKITPYSTSNQLIVVKTDETMLGLVINRVEDIISIPKQFSTEQSAKQGDNLIEFLHRQEEESIAVIDIYALENLLKKGSFTSNIDIDSLFPKDEESCEKFLQRTRALIEKSKANLAKSIFSQDKFISFSLNNGRYCINLEWVREFLKNTLITKIPCTPDYVAGLITIRGDFVTVVDLKKVIGLPSKNGIKKNRIIVIESQDYKVGFLVDEIFSIIEIPEELIDQNAHRQINKYVLSEVVTDDKLYTIFDVKNILSDEKFYIEERA